MADKVSHQDLIREARREIRARKCPRHIRKDAWGHMIDLLVVIAGYLPECWPSERTLAQKMGKERKSIQRWLDRARDEGLIVTTVRPMEHAWRPGQSYHLVCLSQPLRAAIARRQFQASSDAVSKSSSSKKTQTGSPSGIPLGRAAPGCQENPMTWSKNRSDDPSGDFAGVQAIGKDPDDVGPSLMIPAGRDDAVYLARRFDAKWKRLRDKHPDLSDVRGSDRGAATGYLRKVMLTQVSPEHAEAYMDEFIAAVADGGVVVKEGQFAFERFVHWWGRDPIEDPAIEREARARAQAVSDYVRSLDDTPVPFLDRFPKTS